MKRKTSVAVIVVILIMTLLAACGNPVAPTIEPDEFLSRLDATYEELFPVLTATEYDGYWVEEVSGFAGEENADNFVLSLKSACTGTLYGAAAVEAYSAPEEAQFNCYFINGIDRLTVDGNTISGTLDGQKVFSHTYSYKEDRSIEGMADVRVYKTDDDNAGEFTYFLFLDDTPATTYHIEFRYCDDLDALLQVMGGDYAYWLAAGIPVDSSPDFVKSSISLFIEENMSGDSESSNQ
jgi:hypothetical protein